MLDSPGGEVFGIGVTMDLRTRFSGNPDQAICNLSLGINPCITCRREESFIETLRRVSGDLEKLKENKSELFDVIAVEAMARMDFSEFISQLHAGLKYAADTGKYNPLLSNIGVVNPINFGNYQPAEVIFYTPIALPPAFVLGVTTYNRTMTLQSTFSEPGHCREEVERFMDLMTNELSSL